MKNKTIETENNKPDYKFWAKKFDTFKHIYSTSDGTLCRSVAYCLGNNYATIGMPICKECIKAQR